MRKEKTLFKDAGDKNVATRVLYADSGNNLFYDEACTQAVPLEDGLNLFVKGVVAFKEGIYYAAKSCSETGTLNFGLV